MDNKFNYTNSELIKFIIVLYAILYTKNKRSRQSDKITKLSIAISFFCVSYYFTRSTTTQLTSSTSSQSQVWHATQAHAWYTRAYNVRARSSIRSSAIRSTNSINPLDYAVLCVTRVCSVISCLFSQDTSEALHCYAIPCTGSNQKMH